MAKELYILSGLGADERVFQKLDFSGFSVTFIKWVVPEENETIEKYASRLLAQIKTPGPTLLGLSFGGMMAIEIAKQMETEKIILIASAKAKDDIPWYFRMAGKLGIHKLLPAGLLKKSNFILYWFFGVKTSSDKQLLKQIMADTDPVFLEWAIDKIVRWENKTQLKNIFHIHGINDRILPLWFINCNATVEGGHLITLTKADVLNLLIRQELMR